MIGSIAGRRIDRKQSEAYHYSKVTKEYRQATVRIDKLYESLELNWFEKYPKSQAFDEYKQTLDRVKRHLGGDNLPNVDSIPIACSLIEMAHPPRGQEILYDGGFSMFLTE